MQARKFGFGDLLADSAALFRAHAAFITGVTVAIAAGYSLFDLATDQSASSVPGILVTIFVQYFVVERLLADRVSEGARRYGSLCIAGLLGGLGILAGFVLFVLPGLILAAAWSAATPFTVAERMNGTEALGASWRATAASRWPVVLVMIVTYAPAIAALLGALYLFDLAGVADGAAVNVVLNLFVAALGLWGWLLGCAVYRLAVPVKAGLEEVFA